MNEQDQKACAYVNAACTRATLRAMGMQARNMKSAIEGKGPMYVEGDFLEVIEVEGIGFNDVQSVLFHK